MRERKWEQESKIANLMLSSSWEIVAYDYTHNLFYGLCCRCFSNPRMKYDFLFKKPKNGYKKPLIIFFYLKQANAKFEYTKTILRNGKIK